MVFSSYYHYQSNSSNQCDCNETDRLREENLRLEQEQTERREQRRQEVRELAEMNRRSAGNWREALEKQANLYAREAGLYPYLDENGIDGFAVSALACQQAVQIWDELQAEKQSEINELEAKIAALRDSIRVETCSRLRELYAGKPGELDVEGYVILGLEEGGDPEEWLNW